jgi:putative drug exporter of the RND superfamily
VGNARRSTTPTGNPPAPGAPPGSGSTVAAGSGPFGWLGRVVVRHPWRVIALWVIAAGAIIATSPGLPTTTYESSFLPSSYESIRAQNLEDAAFPQQGHTTSDAAIIVFARADSAPLTAADSATVASISPATGLRKSSWSPP